MACALFAMPHCLCCCLHAVSAGKMPYLVLFIHVRAFLFAYSLALLTTQSQAFLA